MFIVSYKLSKCVGLEQPIPLCLHCPFYLSKLDTCVEPWLIEAQISSIHLYMLVCADCLLAMDSLNFCGKTLLSILSLKLTLRLMSEDKS